MAHEAGDGVDAEGVYDDARDEAEEDSGFWTTRRAVLAGSLGVLGLSGGAYVASQPQSTDQNTAGGQGGNGGEGGAGTENGSADVGFGEEYLPVEHVEGSTYRVEVNHLDEFVGGLLTSPESFPGKDDEVTIHGEHDRLFFEEQKIESRPDHYFIGPQDRESGSKDGWAYTFTPGIHQSERIVFATQEDILRGALKYTDTADFESGTKKTAASGNLLAPHYPTDTESQPSRDKFSEGDLPFQDYVDWEKVGDEGAPTYRGILHVDAMMADMAAEGAESYAVYLGDWTAINGV